MDPAPVDDWIAGGLMPEAGLDGRMSAWQGVPLPAVPAGVPAVSHAAQWALPGGRLDEGEMRVDAALRELDEEVGVSSPHSAVLGLLDDYPTRSGYVITPVVIWGGGRLDFGPHPTRWWRSTGSACITAAQRSPRFIAIPESPRPVFRFRWATT